MDFYSTAIVQGLAFAAMGFGIFISLRIFKIPDITTDGSYTLGGAITAVCLINNYNPLLTLFLVLLGGMLSGVATGLIHTRLKVNALLSGILVMTALYSVNLGLMGRSNIPLMNVSDIFSSSFSLFGSGSAVIAVILIHVIVLYAIINWLLKTDFGIAMRATGNNEQMVEAMGVNTRIMKVTGLALANSLTAVSGYLMVQYQGFADINMGIGIVISGLAAVIMGEAFLNIFGTRSIMLHLAGVIAGCIVFRLILAFALDMGLNPNYLKLITSVIVLFVVALTRFRIK